MRLLNPLRSPETCDQSLANQMPWSAHLANQRWARLRRHLPPIKHSGMRGHLLFLTGWLPHFLSNIWRIPFSNDRHPLSLSWWPHDAKLMESPLIPCYHEWWSGWLSGCEHWVWWNTSNSSDQGKHQHLDISVCSSENGIRETDWGHLTVNWEWLWHSDITGARFGAG